VTRTVVFRPEADEEVRSARAWYEAQSPGLGIQFAHAIEQAIDAIATNPFAFRTVRAGTRRAVVRRFPYGVFFHLRDDQIIVTAVMHGRRHPRRWQGRR
jgi:plasmid stabilization system protein ParE